MKLEYRENGESYLTHYWLAISGFMNENKHKNSNGKDFPRSFQLFMHYFTDSGMLFHSWHCHHQPKALWDTSAQQNGDDERMKWYRLKTVTKQKCTGIITNGNYFHLFFFFLETKTSTENSLLYLWLAVCSKEILGSDRCVCVVDKGAGTVLRAHRRGHTPQNLFLCTDSALSKAWIYTYRWNSSLAHFNWQKHL